MRRVHLLPLALLALVSGCGMDSLAGKTTTTGNGGGLTALAPDGSPASGCVVLAARGWDAARGIPLRVDTLRADSTGKVALPVESYAILEVRAVGLPLGAWLRHVTLPEGDSRTLTLDTLRLVRGLWSGRTGRLFLDSSFHSATLQSDGSFAFAELPGGSYLLRHEDMAGQTSALGRLESADGRFTGTLPLALSSSPDTSLWIDDFVSGSGTPRLHEVQPTSSPWFVWWTEMSMDLPSANDADSIRKAIGGDSSRAGKVFHARFSPLNPWASWFSLGVTGLALDLSARRELCLAYRTDSVLKVQFQRDSVAGARPGLSLRLPAAPRWRETCVALESFAPEASTPDSLGRWARFARRVQTLEFQVPPGGTFLDLDDIRLR